MFFILKTKLSMSEDVKIDFIYFFFFILKFKFILFRLLSYEDKLKHFLPDATFLFSISSPSSIMIPLIIIVARSLKEGDL